MAEFKKHVVGEATKGSVAALIGAILLFGTQKWMSNDLEYVRYTRDAYLSAPLGQQGLSISFDGKPLKNVSVVEFSISNRTSRQFANVDLVFTVDDDGKSSLVSGGVMPPRGMSVLETVEELPTRDVRAKKFRLKAVPKQRESEYFHAVFVFEGDHAPQMTVSSVTGDASITRYQQWKDLVAPMATIAVYLVVCCVVVLLIIDFCDYWLEKKRFKKQVTFFDKIAGELKAGGKLHSNDPAAISDARTIFEEFARPKPSRLWSKKVT